MTVSLSAGMRTSLYSMTDIQSQIDQSNKRLGSGRKVNSATDNARAYFAADGYRTEASKLGGLLEGLSQGRQVIDKTVKAIEGAIKLFESADSLARLAQSSSSDTDRATYQTQVSELLTQAARLFGDSSLNGTTLLVNDNQAGATLTKTVANLAAGTAAEKAVATGAVLNIQTNTATSNFTKITVNGIDVRLGSATAGVGMGLTNQAVGSETGFTSVIATGTTLAQASVEAGGWSLTNGARVDRFRTAVNNAINTLKTAGATFATQAASIDIRTSFTKDTVRINNEAADYLVLADINEEGANLSALQTKQQLAVQALSLASRADQAILRLF